MGFLGIENLFFLKKNLFSGNPLYEGKKKGEKK